MNTIKSDRGAAAIEFALVLPLLMFVVFGIIEFGFLLYDKAIITNASREAARSACVYNSLDIDAIKNDIVKKYGSLPIQIPSKPFTASSITITPDPLDTANTGDDVTARIDYDYNFFILPDLQTLFSEDSSLGIVSLSATTVMRRE